MQMVAITMAAMMAITPAAVQAKIRQGGLSLARVNAKRRFEASPLPATPMISPVLSDSLLLVEGVLLLLAVVVVLLAVVLAEAVGVHKSCVQPTVCTRHASTSVHAPCGFWGSRMKSGRQQGGSFALLVSATFMDLIVAPPQESSTLYWNCQSTPVNLIASLLLDVASKFCDATLERDRAKEPENDVSIFAEPETETNGTPSPVPIETPTPVEIEFETLVSQELDVSDPEE